MDSTRQGTLSRLSKVTRVAFVRISKFYPCLAVCLLVCLALLGNLPAQNTQPVSSPSPEPSPTVSATPIFVRTPSPTPSPGARNFHQWGSITLFNGLPSDSVRAIGQTLDGVMWFGTDNGLARFDGSRIQNFSLGERDANRVTVLRTAVNGGLWVGTEKGAFVYSDGKIEQVDGTQNVGVTAILLGVESFFGTSTGHVLRVRSSGEGPLSVEPIFSDALISPDGSPMRITGLVHNGGMLFAATPGRGVFVVDGGRASETGDAGRPLLVNSLANGSGGSLWLGADAPKGLGGIYQTGDGADLVRIAAPTSRVLTLEPAENGVWAGSERYGLFHITGSKLAKTYTFENTSGGLRSDTVFALFTDREGVLWVGTNRGVSRFDRMGPVQETVSDIPNSNFIRTLYQHADGQIYAGSNRGLFIQDGEKWKPVPGYADRTIFALSQDRAGKLLVGMTERETGTREPVEHDTRSFADFQGNKFAAVSGTGLVQLGPGGEVLKHGDPLVNALLGTSEKLWIGTAGKGLFSYDGRSVKIELAPDVLKSGTIWRIFEGVDHILWVAGEHGVFRIENGMPEKVIEAEGVRDVYAADGHVWAATTTAGMLHARKDADLGWLVSTVGFEQGLPSEKAFSILPIDNGLLVATNRGVVKYRPGTVEPKLIPTRIISQRLHDLAEVRSGIELDHPQNSLLVEVAGQSSRTFPEEFQYAFTLKNSKGDVVDSRFSREAQYAPAELKPGSYVIETRAFDRDLLVSEPLRIPLSIARAPFPWTATALGALLVIAIIALIWATVERRHIADRNRELASARSDLASEAERERSRIARDLHDQTLADLRNLMMMSDRMMPESNEFRAEIEAVSTEVRRICEDLSPSVLENVGLVSALEFLLTRSVENHSFYASEDANEMVRLPVIVQLHIYRIAQEVIANITRHSDATQVEMNVDVDDSGRLRLTIGDNGSPFRAHGHNRTGRGISNIRSRANIIMADIGWSERPGEGNIFSLVIGPQTGS